jgi:hypothetical protein
VLSAVTTPVESIVATEVVPLLHVPVDVVSVNVIVDPVHTTVLVPVMVPAEHATVIDTAPLPQLYPCVWVGVPIV